MMKSKYLISTLLAVGGIWLLYEWKKDSPAITGTEGDDEKSNVEGARVAKWKCKKTRPDGTTYIGWCKGKVPVSRLRNPRSGRSRYGWTSEGRGFGVSRRNW